MKDLPHLYRVTSEGKSTGNLITRAENLPDMPVAPPLQFGGPGDQWSPEDLLMASVSSCLVLSFRAIAKASKFEWSAIECESEGVLDKIERKVQFTGILSKVKLLIPASESKEKAEKLLHKADASCLVSNSLSCMSRLECEIEFGGE